MRNKKAGYILGVIELLALLQAYKLWLAPFTTSTVDSFSQLIQVLTGLISVVLLLLPILGLVLIYKEKRWGFVVLAAFPLCCIFFGITAFPGISYFYGNHIKLNSLFTAFANALVCAMAFWFFVSARTDFNPSPTGEINQTEEL